MQETVAQHVLDPTVMYMEEFHFHRPSSERQDDAVQPAAHQESAEKKGPEKRDEPKPIDPSKDAKPLPK